MEVLLRHRLIDAETMRGRIALLDAALHPHAPLNAWLARRLAQMPRTDAA